MSERPHIEMSAKELAERAVRLQEQLEAGYLSPERKAAVEKEMGRVVFEMTNKMVEEKLARLGRGDDAI